MNVIAFLSLVPFCSMLLIGYIEVRSNLGYSSNL